MTVWTADLEDKIADVRRLLRTDQSIEAIAEQLGVIPKTLRDFVRRHGLCDLTERQRIIVRRRVIAREEAS